MVALTNIIPGLATQLNGTDSKSVPCKRKSSNSLPLRILLKLEEYFSLHWSCVFPLRKDGNIQKQAEVSSCFKENKRPHQEQSVAEHICSWDDQGVNKANF